MQVMRLGICGPHSSGKSTLLEQLSATPEFSDIEVLPEITRTIKEQGYEINEKGTLDTQILVMAAHMQNLLIRKRFIVDRTLIDGLCYTKFLRNNSVKTIPDWFVGYCESLVNTYIPMYTKLFYIPAEIPVHDDGVRSTDKHFHDSIVTLFEDQIEYLSEKYPKKIVTITGSVKQRVGSVLEVLHSIM